MNEVLVIGGGMAGAIAALAAREAGASVTLVRRALGATALSSGAIDVAADPFAPGGDLLAHRIAFDQAAREIARRRPRHPYAVLSGQLEHLPRALELAVSRLAGLLESPRRNNLLLPTVLGTVKPTALAQRTQAGANLTDLPEKVAVVGFRLDPHFDPRLVADGLTRAARAVGRRTELVPIVLPFFKRVEDAMRTPYELADVLEGPSRVEELAELLKFKLPEGTGMVLLPPIFGRRSSDLLSRLGEGLGGIPCFEVLSGTPSVPGLRLQDALDEALRKVEVERLDAEVTRSADGVLEICGEAVRPKAMVLATGKYIGGGIRKDEAFKEPVFGLPVFAGGRELSSEFIGDVLGERIVGEQTAFRAGVRIDEGLRPLGSNGKPAVAGLFAAGSVITGFDAAADKTGLGVAIFTGFLAGQAAAAHAQNGGGR